MHQQEIIYQHGKLSTTYLDILKQLDKRYPQDNINETLHQVAQNFNSPTKEDELGDDNQNEGQDNQESDLHKDLPEKSESQKSDIKDALKIETNDNTALNVQKSTNNQVQIDQVLAKVAYGDDETKQNHLLENPDKGEIYALENPVTHSY